MLQNIPKPLPDSVETHWYMTTCMCITCNIYSGIAVNYMYTNILISFGTCN